jgi:predicted phosphoribosyltransferase
VFKNRIEAGERLAAHLARDYKGQDIVVVGLLRGGVVTGRVVADRLGAPLEALVVRKISHPSSPEHACGAIAEGGWTVMSQTKGDLVQTRWLDEEKRRQLDLIALTVERIKGIAQHTDIKEKTAILVDDGLATGFTTEAAIAALRAREPRAIVVAAPVGLISVVHRLKKLVDDVVVSCEPADMFAVSQFYEDFQQVTDDEVDALLGGFANA